MIACQRHLFDVPRDVAYFNCAAYSPYLNTVLQAGMAGVERRRHPWNLNMPGVAAEADRARTLFATLINATGNDIAIVPSASYGTAVASANLTVEAGQHILVLEDQFPSNYYVWKQKAQASGATLRIVPRSGSDGWTAGILAAIGEDTAIVALPACHWMDASTVDLEAVGARCRNVGAALVVDATQSVGAQPFDVDTVKPDFLVCAAYKWLLSPYTLAFLYVAPGRQDGRPLELHNGNHDQTVSKGTYSDSLLDGAARFDMGERYNFTSLPMACAAMEQVLDWGVEEIAASIGVLTDRIADEAGARGWLVPPREQRARHYLGIRLPGGPPEGLIENLARDDVHVATRGPAVRISPHLYNDDRDIDRLIASLDRCLA
jgi:selenocysteine lyase/cysteine desulfurase